jgi:hypothetical protein
MDMIAFVMSLDDIQPSQIYINKEKLDEILKSFDPASFEPLPIIQIEDKTVLTDGHTRALVAYLDGMTHIPVYWDEDELDLEAYSISVQWCLDEGIFTIADLKDRIVSPEEFQTLWIDRCTEMLHQLGHERGECECEHDKEL